MAGAGTVKIERFEANLFFGGKYESLSVHRMGKKESANTIYYL
jgi:hypothetical protein